MVDLCYIGMSKSLKKDFNVLIILSQSYPFGSGESFLEAELDVYSKRFKKIILVPFESEGNARSVPSNVIVETPFKQRFPKFKYAFLSQKHPATRTLFWKEVSETPKVITNPYFFKRLTGGIAKTTLYYQWLLDYLNTHPEYQNACFYTCWFFEQATALGLLKQQLPNIRIVSRAHGHDIYEQDYFPAYIPFRSATLKMIDKVFPVSENGRLHISRAYPEYAHKVQVARLGVRGTPHTTPQSPSEAFFITSCSTMIPIKRLDLMLRGIDVFAKRHPDLKIHWNHLGDGPLKQQVAQQAQALSANVIWSLLGNLSYDKVYDYYRTTSVDVMLHVSETEGIPLSIMEAQSFGIPVIATAVGGVPEIIQGESGILLGKHPTPDDIADALEAYALDRSKLTAAKHSARANWDRHYNAEKNYSAFVQEMLF